MTKGSYSPNFPALLPMNTMEALFSHFLGLLVTLADISRHKE